MNIEIEALQNIIEAVRNERRKEVLTKVKDLYHHTYDQAKTSYNNTEIEQIHEQLSGCLKLAHLATEYKETDFIQQITIRERLIDLIKNIIGLIKTKTS